MLQSARPSRACGADHPRWRPPRRLRFANLEPGAVRSSECVWSRADVRVGVDVEPLADEKPASLQAAPNFLGINVRIDEQHEIPSVDPVIPGVGVVEDRLDRQLPHGCCLARLPNAFVGNVDPCDFPTERGEEDCRLAPLAHANVKRATRSIFHDLRQEGTRREFAWFAVGGFQNLRLASSGSSRQASTSAAMAKTILPARIAGAYYGND